jgi:hypothetical protein
MVKHRSNKGFPPDGIDGMTFAELIHHIHPLFHQNDTKIDPTNHGHFLVEIFIPHNFCSSMQKLCRKKQDSINNAVHQIANSFLNTCHFVASSPKACSVQMHSLERKKINASVELFHLS